MPSTVRHVLFYVPLKPGNLMLCEMGDGKLGVLKDDEPLEGYQWDAADMERAVVAFQKLKAGYLANPAGAAGSPDPSGHAANG